jgi:hypothetical protein
VNFLRFSLNIGKGMGYRESVAGALIKGRIAKLVIYLHQSEWFQLGS